MISIELIGSQIKIILQIPNKADINFIKSIPGSILVTQLDGAPWMIQIKHLPQVIGYFRNRQDVVMSEELKAIAEKQPRTQFEIDKSISDNYHQLLDELNQRNEREEWKSNPVEYRLFTKRYAEAYKEYRSLQNRKKEIAQIDLF